MEFEIIVEDFEYECRRGWCVLRLLLDPAAVADLAALLGEECGLVAQGAVEEPVEVKVAVEDFDYDCRRGGCLLRMELPEREAELLRSRLASLCL